MIQYDLASVDARCHERSRPPTPMKAQQHYEDDDDNKNEDEISMEWIAHSKRTIHRCLSTTAKLARGTSHPQRCVYVKGDRRRDSAFSDSAQESGVNAQDSEAGSRDSTFATSRFKNRNSGLRSTVTELPASTAR